MSVWGRSTSGMVSGFMFVAVSGLIVAGAASATTEAAPLRIKNGHQVMVALGKTREAATGVRPDKGLWTLDLAPELVGAVAAFEDVTATAHGERWNVPVASAKLTLDGTRFLPSHAYRLEIRRDRVVLGRALVYLYPPPTTGVQRVQLDERSDKPEPEDSPSVPGVIPKGGL